MQDHVFVFGSNLAGRHGAGAALTAHTLYGAVYGVGHGRTGMAYGIPTKGWNMETLKLPQIRGYVSAFLQYARANPRVKFMVTAIGCGLAGYKPYQIAPMFKKAPKNCILPKGWRQMPCMFDIVKVDNDLT